MRDELAEELKIIAKRYGVEEDLNFVWGDIAKDFLAILEIDKEAVEELANYPEEPNPVNMNEDLVWDYKERLDKIAEAISKCSLRLKGENN